VRAALAPTHPAEPRRRAFANVAACDFAYLRHFYATGETRAFRSFWLEGRPLLTPLAIPEFHAARWLSRWEGIVV
jgi:hypothetical protein